MKAIILCAGQGRRLLPYTQSTPKCLLEVAGKPIIEWQIDTLLSAGITDIVAVTGYASQNVSQRLTERYPDQSIRCVYNPFYEVADNLASCWMARHEMSGPFLLINGDTLFETSIPASILRSARAPISITIDIKSGYDEDDMKVVTQNDRLLHIGKSLSLDIVTGESIGMTLFDQRGADLFCKKLEGDMYKAASLGRWYLSVIDELAQLHPVYVLSIAGQQWAEVDFVNDLEHAGALASQW